MTQRRVGEIQINSRILRIGDQVYPVPNISRIQVIQRIWRGKQTTYYPLRELTIHLVIIGVIVAQLLDVALFVWVMAALALRAAYLLGLVLYRAYIRQTIQFLMIETAGKQVAALYGKDREEICRVRDEIVQVIDNPPETTRVIELHGDVVFGDKHAGDLYQQFGDDSTMNVNG